MLPLGVTGIAEHYPTPVSFQYSVGVQQAVGTHTVLNVSYVGSQGRRENYYSGGQPPAHLPLPAEVLPVNSTSPLSPIPAIGNMRLAYDGANATYNSLQTTLTGTVRHDLHLQVSYTLAKAMDATTAMAVAVISKRHQPLSGMANDWGPSVYDRRNVFFANFVYDLPVFRNASNRVLRGGLGGWQISAIITENSGAPINIGYAA